MHTETMPCHGDHVYAAVDDIVVIIMIHSFLAVTSMITCKDADLDADDDADPRHEPTTHIGVV